LFISKSFHAKERETMSYKVIFKILESGSLKPRGVIILVFVMLFFAACQSTPYEPIEVPVSIKQLQSEAQAVSPSVSVSDQEIVDGKVKISEVISDGPGWLVVHAQSEGRPGPILGYNQVSGDQNENILVDIDVRNATETLYAMLHTDAGAIGKFEFPEGPDTPVMAGGEVITPAFSVINLNAVEPYVSVMDQQVEADSVKISEVQIDGPGWLVVHAQADGKPGPIIGYQALEPGLSKDVVVKISVPDATETLYAMLHTDAGELGTFEFPDGPDAPIAVDGNVVTPAFVISSSSTETGKAVILRGGNDQLGSFLTGPGGMTLYVFVKDEPGVSHCYDQCAENWPPLVLEGDQALAAGEGVKGDLGTVQRDDGLAQVTYNGLPLYYWINDLEPGEANGHGVQGIWAVAGNEVQNYVIIPGESQVTYEVGEVFLNQDNRFNVAIGVTNQVEGEGFLDLSNPRTAWIGPVSVDISQFTSDSARRDNAIRNDFLESARFPIATFFPNRIEGLPDSYTAGDQATIQITGDLTVHDITHPATFEANLEMVDGVLVGEATTTILMSDFGVGPISVLGILNTEDEVKLTIELTARP
jgi:predicted lipoprotein with Yx(FWY)xxD motif/polyisoprenoid-binding protein YceI